MRLTIIPSDNIVVVDGRGLEVDLSGYATLLEGQHAVQWSNDKGHIEFDNRDKPEFKVNEPIDSIAPYEQIIADWEEAARVDTLERAVSARKLEEAEKAAKEAEAKAVAWKAQAEQQAKAGRL